MARNAICPTGVKLEAAMKLRLEKLSALKDRSVHWLMKEAILRYVENEEQAFELKQETLNRWQEIEQNRVISNESVMAWLDTWGTDHETERPSCEK